MKKNIKNFITNQTVSFEFNRKEIVKDEFLKKYNKTVREKLKGYDEHGVYLWYADDKMIYIGKGGSINNEGNKTKHNVKKRLVASRQRDKNTKKDITTNKFIQKKFKENKKWKKFKIEIFFPKENIPVAIIESILLFEYLKKNNCLPKLNKRF